MRKNYGKDKAVPKGSHRMPDGSIMKDSDMPKKKSKPKRSPKVSKDQVSNKRKYRNAKKKAVESKVKKNAGRNKKKV